MPSNSDFPPGFIWGAATAAPQIEGAAFSDGKGPSVWDSWAHAPGRSGDTLDVACDHYHRYESDFRLMADLGIEHYRLSLAWPRIFPEGAGALNKKGIEFYHRQLDSLEAHGIEPYVTMFHWDLPAALEKQGGWRSRTVIDAFARYADALVQNFGSRVKHWITLNEIRCFTELAYGAGRKAPGVKEGQAVVNQTYHHALLCHGHGVRAVREFGAKGSRVGLTDNPFVHVPVREMPADIEAARELFIRRNIRVLDPIYRGRYDERYLAEAGSAAPRVGEDDFTLIALPTDFLGLNIYTGDFIRRSASGAPEKLPFPRHFPEADSPWLQLNARSLYWGPKLIADIYGVKDFLITENGVGYDDLPPAGGEVLDLHRLEYIRACVREMHRAIADGVPISGYFIWSFMDNFEWEDGYARRFGIVYNDFETQVRTPKLSAQWYRDVIAANRIV